MAASGEECGILEFASSIDWRRRKWELVRRNVQWRLLLLLDADDHLFQGPVVRNSFYSENLLYACAYTDRYADCDSYAYTNFNTYSDANSDTDVHANSDTDVHTNRDTYPYVNADPYSDSYGDSYCNPYLDANSNTDADPNPNMYSRGTMCLYT